MSPIEIHVEKVSPLLGGNVLSPPTPNPVVAVVPVCVLCETDYRKKINNENDHSDTIKQDMCVYTIHVCTCMEKKVSL